MKGRARCGLPIHIRTDRFELRIFSRIMTLGPPQDVTLQELRIETFFCLLICDGGEKWNEDVRRVASLDPQDWIS